MKCKTLSTFYKTLGEEFPKIDQKFERKECELISQLKIKHIGNLLKEHFRKNKDTHKIAGFKWLQSYVLHYTTDSTQWLLCDFLL